MRIWMYKWRCASLLYLFEIMKFDGEKDSKLCVVTWSTNFEGG